MHGIGTADVSTLNKGNTYVKLIELLHLADVKG